MVNPKLNKERLVRTHAINVRSAANMVFNTAGSIRVMLPSSCGEPSVTWEYFKTPFVQPLYTDSVISPAMDLSLEELGLKIDFCLTIT